MPHWVGLDMGDRRTAICVIDRQGTPVLQEECGTTAKEIRAALKPIPRRTIKAIGAEAGTGTHAIRELLHAGLPIRVINALKASKFLGLNRNKSDANDARALAEMVRVGRLTGKDVHTKSLEAQNIQTLMVMRHHLVRQRLKLHQIMLASLKLNGCQLKPRTGSGSIVEAVMSMTASPGVGLSIAKDIVPLAEIVDRIGHQIKVLDKRLSALAHALPACQIMMTVPGVGALTALTVYSAIDDPSRFRRLSDVGAYFGLVPNVYQSGSRMTVGRISRAGNKSARTHLVIAATSLLYRCKTNCNLRTWALSLLQRLGPGKARVALARKLAVLLVRLWKSGLRFDPAIGMA